MPEIIVYVNGDFEPIDNASIPFNDSGFQLGDGLFETIRFNNRKLCFVNSHLNRLRDGLKLLEVRLDKSNIEIIKVLKKLISYNKLESGLLRLMITRGKITNKPWVNENSSSIYISIRPITPTLENKVKVVYFKESNYPIIRFNPAIKSMNYIGNMKAKKDAENQGAYEPVFYNDDGIITECAIRNIFFVKNSAILTPSLDLGVLPGVMRSTIIKIAIKMKLEVKETYIPYDNINNMDEAFISSTGIGLLPCYWDNWKSNYKITKKISKKLNDLLQTKCK